MTRRTGILVGLAAGTAAGVVVVAAAAGPRIRSPQRRSPGSARWPSPRARPWPSERRATSPTGRDVSRWAHVRRPVVARARPADGARAVGRVAMRTPEGTVTALPVTARRTGPGGALWMRVTLPVLPNGTRGWVPRSALGAYEISRDRVVVDLRRQRMTLFKRGRAVFRAPAGVGAAQLADAARHLPDPQPARALQQPAVRPGRLRHERPLPHADRLAGGRVRRHPRHRPAGPPTRTGKPRLRPTPQP